jgi:hypothetical protein
MSDKTQKTNNNLDTKQIAAKAQEAKDKTEAIAKSAIDAAKEEIQDAADAETVWQLQSAEGAKAKEVMTATLQTACDTVKSDLAVNQASDTPMSVHELTEDMIQSGITYLAKVNAIAHLIDEKMQDDKELSPLEYDLLGTGEAEKITFGQIGKVKTGLTQFYKHIMPKEAKTKTVRKATNLRKNMF